MQDDASLLLAAILVGAAVGTAVLLAVLYRRSTDRHEHMLRVDRFAAVGELASGLAHEIRNPLAGLSAALEILAEDLDKYPQKSLIVSEMRHQVAHVGRMMDALIDYARPPRARLQKTDVKATVAKVVFLLRQQRPIAKGVVGVHMELPDDLPFALADPGQLEQTLLNLGLNALQAMQERSGDVVIRGAARGDRITIEVVDNGPGIPEKIRPHVFEPFFTTKPNGTGLGLAISAQIMAEHGGQIEFSCPNAGGTVFRLGLRAAPAVPALGPATGRSESAANEAAA